MWFPQAAREWFDISRQVVSSQREELAALKAERDRLRDELAALRIQNDWLRVQFNQLQLERNALLEKAYNISVPVPHLSHPVPTPELKDFSFDDVGEQAARAMGLPSYEA